MASTPTCYLQSQKKQKNIQVYLRINRFLCDGVGFLSIAAPSEDATGVWDKLPAKLPQTLRLPMLELVRLPTMGMGKTSLPSNLSSSPSLSVAELFSDQIRNV